MFVASVATVVASLPQLHAEEAGIARLSDRTEQSAVKPASYQGCTDGGCAVSPAPMVDPGFNTGYAPAPAPNMGGMATGALGGGCPTGGCNAVNSLRRGMTGGRMTGGGSGFGGFGNGINSRMGSLLGRGGAGGRGGLAGLTGLGSGGGPGGWLSGQVAAYRARNARVSNALVGGFCPSGNCGTGAPPLGSYNMVYAADPNHFDQRDGSLYGAAGYGTNVTVPLAPNVHRQFNYGWGLPSSRITQISTPAGWSARRPIHW